MVLIEDRSFYVYLHIRLDNGAVFYVGKGKNGRAWVESKYHRNLHWQRIVKKCGGFIVAFWKGDITEKEAFAEEISAIKHFRFIGVDLCNQTIGGDGIIGAIRTDEWKKKIGDAHRGKTLTEEVRKKISESVKHSGYIPSVEARAKMSATHKGEKRSLGYRHTDEWKQNASIMRQGNKSRKGQKRSEREKALTSLAMKGRKQKIQTCPYCGKSGGNAMKIWHFENCKMRVA
jgi:hypothetical protein